MSAKPAVRCLAKALTRPTAPSAAVGRCARLATTSNTSSRYFSDAPRATPLSSTSKRQRPTLQPYTQPLARQATPSAQSKRTIFIQTEDTPNADALKFIPNHQVLPDNVPSSFLEYLSPRSTLAPPYPSPLAANLLNVEGVTSVFYGRDYITVTKDSATPWPHVKPEVFALITEAVISGQPIVNTIAAKDGEDAGQGSSQEFTNDINHLILYFVYLFVARFVIGYLATLCICTAAARTTRSIRKKFLESTLRQEVWHFDREDNGSAATQLTTSKVILAS